MKWLHVMGDVLRRVPLLAAPGRKRGAALMLLVGAVLVAPQEVGKFCGSWLNSPGLFSLPEIPSSP